MKVLFVHQNFPAQFKNLAAALAENPAAEVVAIGAQGARPLANVTLHRYFLADQDILATHPFARRFDIECRRAEQVLYLASQIVASGFTPDVVLVHCGWGENLPLRALFPAAKIIVYCELFYRAEGADVNFDPRDPRLTIDGVAALQARNASTLLALAECDLGISPTRWQRSTYPVELRRKIKVCHEGIDVDTAKPDPNASVTLASGEILRKGDEIVTFVCRNLEPLRGYHIFMRALPRILRERKNAHVLIVGGDQVSYGAPPPSGETWKAIYLSEVEDEIDTARVHFLGRLPYETYLQVLQASAVHVYLTYPFVLSWSLLEAMSVGCSIVASATAPVQEIIDGNNGILVDFFDQEALAAAVVQVLDNPERFASMGHQARKTVRQRFRRKYCVQKLLRLVRGADVRPKPAAASIEQASFVDEGTRS